MAAGPSRQAAVQVRTKCMVEASSQAAWWTETPRQTPRSGKTVACTAASANAPSSPGGGSCGPSGRIPAAGEDGGLHGGQRQRPVIPRRRKLRPERADPGQVVATVAPLYAMGRSGLLPSSPPRTPFRKHGLSCIEISGQTIFSWVLEKGHIRFTLLISDLQRSTGIHRRTSTFHTEYADGTQEYFQPDHAFHPQ